MWPCGRSCLNRRGGTPCAAHGVPPPRLTPPPDRRPGHRAPSARGARMARGSAPGRGGGCGDDARVRRTRHHPHALRGSAVGSGTRSSSCVRSGRAVAALASAGVLRYPRPEHRAAAEHPVPDAARVGTAPGRAPQAAAVETPAAQVGLAAAAATDGGGGEPPGAHGSPSPHAAPCGPGPIPVAAREASASV
jgi:hypothetical protein